MTGLRSYHAGYAAEDQVATHYLRHGMPVDVFVKTGERPLASYLLKPLTDRMRSGMREN